jgi:hypothetical protein
MSSAVDLPSQADIDHLLARARRRNESEDVTGILLYDEGSFFQVIEGPADGVGRVYAAILADPLHYNVLELLDDKINARDFDGWAMAYRSIDLGAVGPADAMTAKLNAPPGDLSAVHHLLAAFWNGGLGARYQSVTGSKPTRRDARGPGDEGCLRRP